MGISRLKRLLLEELSMTFKTEELQLFIRLIDNNFDLHKLTGFLPNITIPRKDAAKAVVDYFFETKRVIHLLNLIIYTSKNGFKGEIIEFNGIQSILREMEECGYIYDNDLKKVVILEKKQEKRNDWGFLEENKVYNFCFASVDICGNSKLVRKYDNSLIKETYKNYKKLVTNTVEARNGRIWSWEGDGGLFVFHLDDFVKDTILSSIEILSSMIIFNATANLVGEDIKIRIGINAGEAEYKRQTNSIISDAIEKTRLIEKKYTKPGTISVSKHTALHLDSRIKNYLIETEVNCFPIYQLKLPVWRV